MSMHGHLSAAAGVVIVRAGQLVVPEDQTVPSNHCSLMPLIHLEEVRSSSIPDNHATVLDTDSVGNSSMALAQHLN